MKYLIEPQRQRGLPFSGEAPSYSALSSPSSLDTPGNITWETFCSGSAGGQNLRTCVWQPINGYQVIDCIG